MEGQQHTHKVSQSQNHYENGRQQDCEIFILSLFVLSFPTFCYSIIDERNTPSDFAFVFIAVVKRSFNTDVDESLVLLIQCSPNTV